MDQLTTQPTTKQPLLLRALGFSMEGQAHFENVNIIITIVIVFLISVAVVKSLR